MWRSHECCRATNVAMPRMSKGRMFSTNAGGECGGATDVAEQRMSATNVAEQRMCEARMSSTFIIVEPHLFSSPLFPSLPLFSPFLPFLNFFSLLFPIKNKKGANRSSLLNSNLNLNYYFLITRMVMFELLLLRFTK